MQEALMLFQNICNSHWFRRTAMILFLNKIDLLVEKLTISSVSYFFPDFDGNELDQNAVFHFFSRKFLALNRSHSKDVYVHQTNATDRELLNRVMLSVEDTYGSYL